MKIEKAIGIMDAEIRFVSLVDKAANKRRFLIAKGENGSACFSGYGRIIKAEDDTHYLTGIVYEPMVEDAQGNYMTAEEVKKAAYWFAKNSDKVDLQHSFENAPGISVVESYIAPCDLQISGEIVIRGSWLMTVEVKNGGVWEGVQNGCITGFSMGGTGRYCEEDIELKEENGIVKTDGQEEKKGLLKRLAEIFYPEIIGENIYEDEIPDRQEIQKMVDEAVLKHVDKADIQEMVQDCVNKAVEPILKARGCASNLNKIAVVEKSVSGHYLEGIL